jgi:glucose-6-phosphate isomerase
MIQIDYTYMMADVVGADKGISTVELEAMAGRVREIHADLQERRQQGELPVYDLPYEKETVAQIKKVADEWAGRFDALVVLGIGGSALGTTAVATALLPGLYNQLDRAARNGRPRLYVLDNVDPVSIKQLLAHLDPENTCFCVISKSGATVETMGQFLIARQWLQTSVGADHVDHMLLVTDPEKGVLRRLAKTEGYRSFAIPAGVGGRFSVLTAVGLLPLAIAGVDIERLLAGAAAFAGRLESPVLMENPAYLNAVLHYLAYNKGMPISVLMPYCDRLTDFTDWFRQLWAESLGKKNRLDGRVEPVGPTPVKAIGATDQHSQVQLYVEGPADKMVTFVTVAEVEDIPFPEEIDIPELDYLAGKTVGDLLASEQCATAAALARSGRPSVTLQLESLSPEHLGALIYMFEVQTIFAGALFDVDPLDQPGVEAGKDITYALMGRTGFSSVRNDLENWLETVERRII